MERSGRSPGARNGVEEARAPLPRVLNIGTFNYYVRNTGRLLD